MEVAPDKEVILIEATFTGIVRETMTKFSDDQSDVWGFLSSDMLCLVLICSSTLGGQNLSFLACCFGQSQFTHFMNMGCKTSNILCHQIMTILLVVSTIFCNHLCSLVHYIATATVLQCLSMKKKNFYILFCQCSTLMHLLT